MFTVDVKQQYNSNNKSYLELCLPSEHISWFILGIELLCGVSCRQICVYLVLGHVLSAEILNVLIKFLYTMALIYVPLHCVSLLLPIILRFTEFRCRIVHNNADYCILPLSGVVKKHSAKKNKKYELTTKINTFIFQTSCYGRALMRIWRQFQFCFPQTLCCGLMVG